MRHYLHHDATVTNIARLVFEYSNYRKKTSWFQCRQKTTKRVNIVNKKTTFWKSCLDSTVFVNWLIIINCLIYNKHNLCNQQGSGTEGCLDVTRLRQMCFRKNDHPVKYNIIQKLAVKRMAMCGNGFLFKAKFSITW